MVSTHRYLLLIASMCMLSFAAGYAQDTLITGSRSSIGFRAGYGRPWGEWANSRVAPEIQLFSGGVSAEADISFRLGERWTLALGGSYTKLSGSRWDAGTTFNGIHRSTDGGMTWGAASAGLPNSAGGGPFALQGSTLFAGTTPGASGPPPAVYLSTDAGGKWQKMVSPNSMISSLAFCHSNLFVGLKSGAGGILMSTDRGITWTPAGTGLPNYTYVYSLACKDSALFAACRNGVYVTTNGGGRWTAINNGLGQSSYLYVYALAISDSNLFIGKGDGVYRSSFDSINWTKVNNGLPSYPSIEYLAAVGPYLFAGTDGNGVYLSNDNGESWTALNTGMPTNVTVYSLAVSGGNLFAGTADYDIWRRPISEIVQLFAPCLLYPPPNAILTESVFAFRWRSVTHAQSFHLQASKDSVFQGSFLINDSTLTDTTRLSTPSDSGLAHPPSGTYYWKVRVKTVAGWSSWSAPYRYQYSPTGIAESETTPLLFSLDQNYPNPFNPATGIRFQVASTVDVKLVVYDLIGREVATLVNERKAPGSYEVTFDASNLASAVYICRLKAGSFVQSRKMMLIK